MAQLRTIGAYVENSRLDFSWTEADLYGPATVKQILEGRHMRRAIEAHVGTTQTLYLLYQEAFFENHPELVSGLTAAAENIRQACAGGSSEIVQQAHGQSPPLQDFSTSYISKNQLLTRPLFATLS